MSGKEHHLAQFNVARMLAPIDDPVMEGFRSQLEPINALADRSPGFVWRLKTEDGDATSIRAYPDPLVIVNMSVWESLDALHAFVYRSHHVGPLRDRRQWFEPTSGPILVLWWVPKGHIPWVREAMERLEHLRVHGPSQSAFTFRTPFPPPGETGTDFPEVDAEFCFPQGGSEGETAPAVWILGLTSPDFFANHQATEDRASNRSRLSSPGASGKARLLGKRRKTT